MSRYLLQWQIFFAYFTGCTESHGFFFLPATNVTLLPVLYPPANSQKYLKMKRRHHPDTTGPRKQPTWLDMSFLEIDELVEMYRPPKFTATVEGSSTWRVAEIKSFRKGDQLFLLLKDDKESDDEDKEADDEDKDQEERQWVQVIIRNVTSTEALHSVASSIPDVASAMKVRVIIQNVTSTKASHSVASSIQDDASSMKQVSESGSLGVLSLTISMSSDSEKHSDFWLKCVITPKSGQEGGQEAKPIVSLADTNRPLSPISPTSPAYSPTSP